MNMVKNKTTFNHLSHSTCTTVHVLNIFLITMEKIDLQQYNIEGRKRGNILFNNALNTFYLHCLALDHSDSERGNLLLYTPSYIQDSKFYALCYTSFEALAGMRNSSMGPP